MGFLEKLLNGKSDTTTVDMSKERPISSYVNSDDPYKDTSIVSVDEEVAMKIASLNQGINIISETIASMPVYLYQEQDGFHQVFYDDPRSRIMSDMANDVLSAFNVKSNLIKDVILYGNGYSKIVREGKDVKLVYYPPEVVEPKMDNNGFYFEIKSHSTEVNGEKVEAEIVDLYDMLVLVRGNKYNSIVGTGILERGSTILSMAVEENDYLMNIFKHGLSARAVLASKTPFKKEVKEQLKRDLANMYSGSKNAGKMMVLDGVDMSLVPFTLSPADLKLLDNKKFTISEIARLLNIPKHMLNLDRQQGTYSNITQERLQLLQNTLMPYVVMIESAMNSKLLTPQEIEQGFYFKFDTSELMKMTPEDQANYMLKLFEKDIVTIEEVRASLGLGGEEEVIAQLKAIQEAKTNMAINKATEPKKEETPQEEKPSPSPVEETGKKGQKEKEKTSKEVNEK